MLSRLGYAEIAMGSAKRPNESFDAKQTSQAHFFHGTQPPFNSMSRLYKIKDKIFKRNLCPLCQHKEGKGLYVYFYDDKQSDIIECCQCGHRWITPAPL